MISAFEDFVVDTLELPKAVMVWIMPIFDVTACLLILYIALRLTKDFGFGSKREWLLFLHRFILILCSLGFAYHSLDIWRDPDRHGLTFSNFQLHLLLVTALFFSAVRVTEAEKPLYHGKNGDAFAGPFPRKGPK